ncbi:LuxR C-terminal-related transcriptional regulator [Nocardia sp. NPDC057440]|uniref:helix-turn-helix transcriptional regulator n=1 Tax=Nocardia sp. NPDC057440 TaxID=3346134 RepID=UPI00367183BB
MSVRRSSSIGALPAAASDFVGRERELEKIATLLLDSARLITLIGSGGIGKTRLATEAVHRYHRARRVPVYWVRLARLTKGADATAIEDEAAQAIVDADFSGRSAWAALVDTLTRSDAVGRKWQTILVMDNCEHVLDGVGGLIADLLDAVPGLTVLATSREAIGWVDEQLVPVGALPREQALTLFRKRAELTGHAIRDDQLALADSICRHMHNHPLYIRLAAGRLLRQPLPTILRDLSGEVTDRRLRWSHGPRVGADERHQGIRDVIAWSFDLCRDEERLLFERMSVFAAGYDVDPDDEGGASALDVGAEREAIEEVCADLDIVVSGAQVHIARDEVEDLLERLVDQSLVSVHLTPTAVRYSLVESFRVFAQQRLRERSQGAEWVRLTGRHRRYYRDRVARAQAEWFGPSEQDLLDWARAEWDNLLCAIDSSLEIPGEAAIGLEIAIGLIALRVPFFRGSLRESRRWAERTLAATRDLDPQPVELQISAMALIGWISMCQGVHDDAERMLDDCVAACIEDPEVRENWRNTPERDLDLPAPVEFTRGGELLLVQCDPRAVAVLGHAREKFTARGDLGGAAMSELFEALAAGFCGTADQAMDIARRHLDNATASGAVWAKSWAELAWALALTKHGDPREALMVGRTALADQLSMRDQWGVIWAVHIRTWTLARMLEDAESANGAASDRIGWAAEIAQLIGGASTVRQRLGVNIANLGPFDVETAKAIEIAREVLGHKDFAAAEREGSMLRPEHDEVARLALGTLSLDKLTVDHPVRQKRRSPWHELSTAEQEVARFAAAGWTNTAIAARRGSSFKTVDAQMVAIFQKLMITSRSDIVGLVPADQRAEVARAAARRPADQRQRKHRP